MTDGPLARYRSLVAQGGLKPDTSQELAAEKLESLHHALKGYVPRAGAGGWRARLGLARRADPAPQGLYLYGAVGRGKSMLMDLLYETAPIEKKRRVHFHAFMLEVHDRWHRWRTGKSALKGDLDDPMPTLARVLADEAWLLCFDEFHVVDVADAMILGRLFASLFELGVVVVATSNWAPGDLYADGLQRDRFLPFIALVKETLDVLHLDGGIDYRMARLRGRPTYYFPLGRETDEALARAFSVLTDGATGAPDTLTVKGRRIEIPRAAKGVAWADFESLCGRPLGAVDYLALADRYHTLILSGVPRLRQRQRDKAKRLITLIDALYENRAKLVLGADAAPEGLLEGGLGDLEFRRAVSRLNEMQAADYLGLAHKAA